MRTAIAMLSLMFLAPVLGILGVLAKDPLTPAQTIETVDRNNFFNMELLQKIQEFQPKNDVISPANVKVALMLLAEAARDSTRQQILSALRLTPNISYMRNLANVSDLNFKTEGTEMETATKLWAAKSIKIGKDFEATLNKYYRGEVANLDFNDTKLAANTINSWVKNLTHGHIDKLVEPDSLSGATRSLLTTATYFSGIWKHSFDKNGTAQRCFFVPSDGCYLVPLMVNKAKYNFNYVPALDADVVEIPYTGDRISMLVLLPKMEGLAALNSLTRDMTFTPMSTILASLQETELELAMPKFTIESKNDMRPYLEQLGIRDLFDSFADLNNGFPDGGLMIDKILHNAKIEVNEKGTIAAAATGVSIVPLMGSTDPIFRADRPFVFLMVDRKTNGVLFGGRVVKLGEKRKLHERRHAVVHKTQNVLRTARLRPIRFNPYW